MWTYRQSLIFKKMEKQCNCNCETRIYCDVYIPENAGLSVETINGNIIISGNTAEIRAHSISGFVDLTLAANRKADFKLNTISGTIYSNISINTAKRGRFSTHIATNIMAEGRQLILKPSAEIFFSARQNSVLSWKLNDWEKVTASMHGTSLFLNENWSVDCWVLIISMAAHEDQAE